MSAKTLANPYRPVRAVLEKVHTETAGIKSFWLRPETPFAFRAGQFAELTVPGVGEAPFAMASSNKEPELLQFTVQRVGYMTEQLHALEPGAVLGLRGPFGNGFPFETYFGRRLLLVIGGVGFPPAMAFLHAALAQQDRFPSIQMCYGARTPSDLVYKDRIESLGRQIDLKVTVDKAEEGWTGPVGVVTTLLRPEEVRPESTQAVVIGPPIMMKFATLKLLELGFDPGHITLSMERKMYCGIGQCRHCMIDNLFICKDGPVFTYDQLKDLPDIWE